MYGSLAGAISTRIIVIGTSSSSATSIGIEVKVPCPISTRALMIVTWLSGEILTHAFGIAPGANALGGRLLGVDIDDIEAQPTISPLPISPPLTATVVFRKWRRERSCRTALMSGSLRGG